MKRLLAIVALGATFAVAARAEAALIYESATLGPTGQQTGYSLASYQWLGVRFTLTTTTRITRIGGHYYIMGAPPGFIGIFPIGATNFPPLPANVASALVSAPLPTQTPSADVGVNVDITLPPGTYALVLGVSAPGASGGMPFNNPLVGTPSYFYLDSFSWQDGGFSDARFFIEGSVCGNGVTEAPETCDDANASNSDGCLDTCVLAGCGDGFTQTGVEECDDGNTDDTDGCLSTCELASCGDGLVQAPEACDDGNADNTDACLSSCSLASCGDGFTQIGVEECDDGNTDETDACLNSCILASCGDGIVQAPEECDDGDANSDTTPDACRESCLEADCGDGVVDTGEECDEGDLNGLGECTATCTVAAGEGGGGQGGSGEGGGNATTNSSSTTSMTSTTGGPDEGGSGGGSSDADEVTDDDGCSCRSPGSSDAPLAPVALALLGLALRARRRKTASRR